MSRTSALHPRLRALSRAVSWHRRKLAVVAAVLAVLTGVNAAMPADPPTVEVVQAAVRLEGGAVLVPADLKLVRLSPEAVPDGALGTVAEATGRAASAPVAEGAVLTDLSVLPVSRTVARGRVVAPLRLADADVAGLLDIGQLVDVVAADSEAPQAAVVARAVRVVALPRPPESSGVAGSTSSSLGGLVLVDVDAKTATVLAQAAVTSTLSVLLR